MSDTFSSSADRTPGLEGRAGRRKDHPKLVLPVTGKAAAAREHADEQEAIRETQGYSALLQQTQRIRRKKKKMWEGGGE